MAVVVTYNSTVVPNIIGAVNFRQAYEQVAFSCSFLVKSDTAANLVAACATLESKFREPYKRLTVVFGGTSEYDFNHSGNTCLNPQVSITKGASDLDTETSRAYKFDFVAGLPADLSGFNFRRKGDFSVEIQASGLRKVVFDLEYTASPTSTTALANFNSFAESYATTTLGSLFSGVVFELVRERKNADQENKVCTGSLIYEELIEAETLSTSNSAKIKNVRTNYDVVLTKRIGVSSGGYIMTPLLTVRCSYSAEAVIAQFSTNDEIKTLYDSEIRPHILARAIVNLKLERETGIITSDSYRFDPVNSMFSGQLEIIFPSTTSDIIFLDETLVENQQSGIVLEKLWDGEQYTNAGYHMGAEAQFTRNITVVTLGAPATFPSIFPQQDLILLARSRSVKEELVDGVRYFSSNFNELYKKSVVINLAQIPIPAPVTFSAT